VKTRLYNIRVTFLNYLVEFERFWTCEYDRSFMRSFD
jgi:hypothetical protein